MTTATPAAAPTTTPAPARPRSFVPRQFDPADFGQIEPLYRQLLARPLDTKEQLEKWLADASELTGVLDEYWARRYIDKSCHTDDPRIEAAYLHYIENVDPRIKPLHFALQKQFLASPARSSLDPKRFGQLQRQWATDVEVFRDENVPIETRLEKLGTEYDKIMGALLVDFRGGQYTMPQMAKFLEDPDRPTRKEAWEAMTNRRLAEREKVDAIFDEMVTLRGELTKNAGLADYRELTWKKKFRFDYTPDDCLRFADAIERVCVPAARELMRRRAKDLGLGTDVVRPWDTEVDPKNRPPLKPFDEKDVDGFVERTRRIVSHLSPELADDFDALRRNKNLDLGTRKGKQPGGYQCSLPESCEPFIFMNAAGLHRDVEVLLHEGGHAFHFQAASRAEPLVFLRRSPMEFCEVASMSMELLGSEHFGEFYAEEAEAARGRRQLFEGIIRFFPWMALIDSFQHWIYTNPGHTQADRNAQWLRLHSRFIAGVDWSGYEEQRASHWHRQLHLFTHPFYYVEYGIAQLGALQVWMKSKEDPRRALANYRAALALGGTRSLPELFAAAGIVFDFSEKTLRPLIAALQQELAELSA